jgi:hypothetical protein
MNFSFSIPQRRSNMVSRRFRGRLLAATALALLVLTAGVTQADIVHRYSFNGSDASDSVGSADGTLVGNATVSGGQLFLDQSDDLVPSYVTLPIGDTIAGLRSTTIEAWVTWMPDTTLYLGWHRVFDFGQGTMQNMFLTPYNGNNRRVRFAITTNGGGDEEQTTSARLFPMGVETHVAVTLDADLGMTVLYLNGVAQAVEFGDILTPGDLGSTTNNYLGKSQYADLYFQGFYDEFRVYNTALSPDDINASFMAGPDAPIP